MAAITMGRLIKTALAAGVPAVLTVHAFAELSHQKGGDDAAMRWLVEQASAAQIPIVLNVPNADESSTSLVIGPRGWTEERTKGYIAARIDSLSQVFGPAVGFRTTEETTRR